jgi:hypothetical protein
MTGLPEKLAAATPAALVSRQPQLVDSQQITKIFTP